MTKIGAGVWRINSSSLNCYYCCCCLLKIWNEYEFERNVTVAHSFHPLEVSHFLFKLFKWTTFNAHLRNVIQKNISYNRQGTIESWERERKEKLFSFFFFIPVHCRHFWCDNIEMFSITNFKLIVIHSWWVEKHFDSPYRTLLHLFTSLSRSLKLLTWMEIKNLPHAWIGYIVSLLTGTRDEKKRERWNNVSIRNEIMREFLPLNNQFNLHYY